MKTKFADVIGTLIALPILGILMGGVYSLPAMRITKCREPWYTITLGIGLSITVLAISFIYELPVNRVSIAWAIACALLLIRRSFGKLDHNIERYGLIHGITLVGMAWLVILSK